MGLLKLFSKRDAGKVEPVFAGKPGYEFWRMKRFAERSRFTQTQFDDFMNNPDFYQLEDPATHAWRASEVERRRKRTSFDDNDPIHLAVADHNVDEVRNLLATGSKFDVLDQEGRTPLFYAAMDGELAIAEELVRRGAEVNSQDHHGETPLHFAARYYRPGLAEFLLNQGAVVDQRDMHGNTPLAWAVWEAWDRGEVIKLLLAHGADMHVENDHGHSPLDRASSISNHDARQFLAA